MAKSERSARTVSCSRGFFIGALLWIWCLQAANVQAQIAIGTGLHNNATLNGITAPSEPAPFANSFDVLVRGTGETDPALYSDISFYATGIRSSVPVINHGGIDVTATGGAAGANSFEAYGSTHGYGIWDDVVDNRGAIAVSVTGSTIDVDGTGYDRANAYAHSFGMGLYAGSVVNAGDIDVSTAGGTANVNAPSTLYGYLYTEAGANASVYGIQASDTTQNSGAITVEATGGHTFTEGNGGNHAVLQSNVSVYGIFGGDRIDNTGAVSAAGTGGIADANSSRDSYVSAQAGATVAGLYSLGTVQNHGVLTVTAAGGSATGVGYLQNYATANAKGYGIYTDGRVDNVAGITGTATGGYALVDGGSNDRHYPLGDAYADGEIYGIYSSYGDVNNTGEVLITAAGGHTEAGAQAIEYSWTHAGANANAQGIYVSDVGTRVVTNTGDVTAVATAGYAHARIQGYEAEVHADATASGITTYGEAGEVQNVGNLDVTATGGQAEVHGESAYTVATTAYAEAFGYGVNAYGDVDNIGMITVTATGGAAHADAVGASPYVDGRTDAHGWGILSQERGIDNAGDISVNVSAGTVDGDGIDSYAMSADAEAYGLQAAQAIGNSGTITIRACAGTADVNGYSGVPASARADAYGIKSDAGVINSGTIGMEVSGGTIVSGDSGTTAAAANVGAYGAGVYGNKDVTNGGFITVTVTKGSSAAAGDAEARGLYSKKSVSNGGFVSVTANAGAASPDTQATAVGIMTDNGAVDNRGEITASAVGGLALASGIAGINSAATGTGRILAAATGGTSDADATGDLDASAYAYGIDLVSGPVQYSGAIAARAEGGTIDTDDISSSGIAQARAYGIRTDGDIDNGDMIEIAATAGAVHAEVADAYATASGLYSGYGSVTNDSRITVAAVGGQLRSTDVGPGGIADATAQALGAYSYNGSINNTGDLTALARGGAAVVSASDTPGQVLASAAAYGLFREGYISPTHHVINTGTIMATAIGGSAGTSSDEADASALAYGISSEGVSVRNSGLVIAVAGGGTASSQGNAGHYAAALAGGISSSGVNADPGMLEIRNTGSISVAAHGGSAAADAGSALAYGAGILALAIDVNNSGTIVVASESDNTALSTAHGISAVGDGRERVLVNSGDITVTARGGSAEAIGLAAHAMTVRNSGSVSATAIAGEGLASTAYGVYTLGDTSLTNTGLLRASGQSAYEVCVAGGTTTLVDTYNVTLDGDPRQASILVGNGARMNLNNATLTVASVSEETRWDTPYRLFETAGTGAIQGSFRGAAAQNPNVYVGYDNHKSSNPTDDTVMLSYTPLAAAAPHASAVEKQTVSQAVDVVNRRLTTDLLLDVLSPVGSPLLADAGPALESLAVARSASDRKADIYVEPYYSRLSQDADPLGYKADLWGFSGGYEKRIDDTLWDLHLGYGRSGINYTGAGYQGNDEDQDVLTGGLGGLTRWDPWTLRYGVSGFYGWHDYSGLTGLSLNDRETASYNSYGAAATAMAGYIIRREQHVFLPEAGLTYIWAHRPAYTTDATDPGWDTTCSSIDDHDVQAEAALHWLSSFTRWNLQIVPSASIGVRHLLTDNTTGVRLSVPGAAAVMVESECDRTALTLSGSLTLTRVPHAVSLAYDGDYAPDTQRHSFWLRYSLLF